MLNVEVIKESLIIEILYINTILVYITLNPLWWNLIFELRNENISNTTSGHAYHFARNQKFWYLIVIEIQHMELIRKSLILI